MRFLFAILFIILGPQAWAVDCDPMPFGSGTQFTIVTDMPGGIGISHICIVNGVPRVQEPIVMRTGFVPPAGCASSIDGLVLDMKLKGINGLLAKCSAPWPAAEIPLRDAIAARVRQDVSDKWFKDHPELVVQPPPKTCTVAPNGLAKTRQWYSFAAGARTSTTGGGSVTIAGTACRPDVAGVVEGSTQYGAFGPSFRTDRVTVCTCQ